MPNMRATCIRVALVLAAGLSLGAAAACQRVETPDTSTVQPTDSAAAPVSVQGPFRLGEGMERDACGIGVRVKFLPVIVTPGPTTPVFAFAVVYGGPVGAVPDKLNGQSATQPLPDNAAHAVPGVTITVFGKHFDVDNVDAGTATVELRPEC